MPLRNHWNKPNLAGNTHQRSSQHHVKPRTFTHGDPRSARMKKSLENKVHPDPQPHPIKHTGAVSHKQPVRYRHPVFKSQ